MMDVGSLIPGLLVSPRVSLRKKISLMFYLMTFRHGRIFCQEMKGRALSWGLGPISVWQLLISMDGIWAWAVWLLTI